MQSMFKLDRLLPRRPAPRVPERRHREPLPRMRWYR
jgi:hypothetical protein